MHCVRMEQSTWAHTSNDNGSSVLAGIQLLFVVFSKLIWEGSLCRLMVSDGVASSAKHPFPQVHTSGPLGQARDDNSNTTLCHSIRQQLYMQAWIRLDFWCDAMYWWLTYLQASAGFEWFLVSMLERVKRLELYFKCPEALQKQMLLWAIKDVEVWRSFMKSLRYQENLPNQPDVGADSSNSFWCCLRARAHR